MREELLIERSFLEAEMRMCIMYFMKETDKEEASKILVALRKRADRIEAINCELAGIELRQKIFGKGESK